MRLSLRTKLQNAEGRLALLMAEGERDHEISGRIHSARARVQKKRCLRRTIAILRLRLGIVCLALIALPPLPAHADDAVCRGLAELGKTFVLNRHEGVPLSSVLDTLQAIPAILKPVYRLIAVEAYKRPRYRTESVITQDAQDYADELLIGCLEAQESD